MFAYLKAVTEQVTDTEHSEREAFGVSFLCYVSAKTSPELCCPTRAIPKSKRLRIPALKDRVIKTPKRKTKVEPCIRTYCTLDVSRKT